MQYAHKARIGGEVFNGRPFSPVEIEKNGGISEAMLREMHQTLWDGLLSVAADEGLVLGEPRFHGSINHADLGRPPFAAVTATVIAMK